MEIEEIELLEIEESKNRKSFYKKTRELKFSIVWIWFEQETSRALADCIQNKYYVIAILKFLCFFAIFVGVALTIDKILNDCFP